MLTWEVRLNMCATAELLEWSENCTPPLSSWVSEIIYTKKILLNYLSPQA